MKKSAVVIIHQAPQDGNHQGSVDVDGDKSVIKEQYIDGINTSENKVKQ